MRGEDLFNAMSGIDDELLIQSESRFAASQKAPGDNTDVVHNGSKEQNAGGEPGGGNRRRGGGNRRRGGGKVIPGWAVFALTAAACLAIVFVTRDAGRSGMDSIGAGNSAVMSSDQARMDGEVSPQEDPAEAAPKAEEADQVLQEAEEAAEQPQSDAGGADGKTQKTEEGTAAGAGADDSGKVQKPAAEQKAAPEQETAQGDKKENIGGRSQDSGNKAGYAGQNHEGNGDKAEKVQPAEDERAQEAEPGEADPRDESSHADEAALPDETEAEGSEAETAAEDSEAKAESGEESKDADAAGDASRDEETAEKTEAPAEVSTDKTKEQAENTEGSAAEAEAEQSGGEEEAAVTSEEKPGKAQGDAENAEAEETDKSRTSADLLGEHKGSYVKLEYISAADEAKGAERTEPEYSEEGEAALRVIFDSSHSTDKNEGDRKKQKEKESAQKDKTADKGPAIYYMYLTDENGGSERIIFYKKNCVTMDSRPGEVIRVRESEYNDVLKLFK